MLVKYNGELTKQSRSYGCSKCGTGRSINGQEVYTYEFRTYYGGRLFIFKKDEPVEVDDLLGKFLSEKVYTDSNGVVTKSFTVVTEPLG